MLEILFLSWFVRKLAADAKSRGRAGTWGGLGAGLWIAGEVLGFVIGTVAEIGTGGTYLLALVCAALGAGIAFVVVDSLGELAEPQPLAADPSAPKYDPANPYSPPPSGSAGATRRP